MKRYFSLIFNIFLFIMGTYARQYVPDTIGNSTNYNLDEVIVTGTRVPVSRNIFPVPVSVVQRGMIEQSEEINLMPVLAKHVPGLFITSRGITGYGVSGGAAGGINLRGLSGGSGRVLILIDGHPQYATIFGHPVADAYIASDAQRVEVSHGAASILYGSNAMGGAINIITREAQEKGNHMSVRLMGGSYGTQRYSLTDSYRKGKLSAVLSGNYDKTDGHRKNISFDMWAGYAKLGYEFSDQWRVTGNVNIAHANSQNPGTINSPLLDATADVLRGMSGLSFENNYGRTNGAMNFYYNWGNHKINDGHTPGANPQAFLFRSTDYMGGVNIYQSVHPFTGNTVTGGFDVKLYGGNAYRNPETEKFVDHIKLNEVAGYLFVQQKIGPCMANAGIRLENHKLYGNEWVPQVGLSYRAATQTHLKFSVSKGFRAPNMRELYMYMIANENLLPERSMSYDFTVSQGLLENHMTTELTFYYITGDNIITPIQVDGHQQNMNVGDFTNKGIEFTLKYNIINDLQLHGNYSYLHMDKPIAGAPRHKAYAGLTYKAGRFSLDLGAQVINKLYLIAEKEDVQTDNFTLVDARVSYKVREWIDFFMKGDNLLAQKYQTMAGYPMPRTTFMGGVSINLY